MCPCLRKNKGEGPLCSGAHPPGEMRAAATAATGGLAPARGCSHGGAPPILFLVAPKRECAAPGGREKGAWRAPVQWPSARDGGRRIGACSDFAWPSGTLGSSASLQLPSRGGWCGGRRGARTHLTSFSFRAFRFATRCPGGRGGLYRRADEGIRPYEITAGLPNPVGADALIGPLRRLSSTTG